MKLNERTLSILNNWSRINENILIKEGDRLETQNINNSVFAYATLDQTFLSEVPLYNLNEFLKTLKLFQDPDLHFEEGYIEIQDESSKVTYRHANKATLTYPKKEVKFPEPDVSFTLTAENLKKILSAADCMVLSTISLMNIDGDLVLRAHSNGESNQYDLVIGDDNTGKDEFIMDFNKELFLFMEMDYQVDISFKGISKFYNTDEKVEYIVGLKAKKQ